MADDDVMNYKKQIETGIQSVMEALPGLAVELKQPDIEGFKCIRTHRDFDNQQVSLIDPKKNRVVSKLEEKNLADCSADPSRKRRLKSQVEEDVRSYYSPSH